MPDRNKTREELTEANTRLRDLNNALSQQLIGKNDQMQEVAHQIARQAWDQGFAKGGDLAAWAIGQRPDSERPDTTNPYAPAEENQ